jgi:hypothetical protein
VSERVDADRKTLNPFGVPTYIDTELSIVDGISKVAAVRKVVPAPILRVWNTQTLINHIPNETTLKAWSILAPERFPIQV